MYVLEILNTLSSPVRLIDLLSSQIFRLMYTLPSLLLLTIYQRFCDHVCVPSDQLQFNTLKNADFTETEISDPRNGETVLRFAVANGFRNIQNLVQKMKRKRCTYHFVEVMACPSGCLNGGAQAR